MMGKTQQGKSTFVNKATGKHKMADEGTGNFSETSDITCYPSQIWNVSGCQKKFNVIDTPGL